MKKHRQVLDTAIIGAGVGGLYSAWRLSSAKESKAKARDVHVFEMGDRIGGRLFTVNMPGMPSVNTELGGMRVLSLQKIVQGVIKELGIELEDFPMGGPQNLAYIRGKRFPVSAYNDPKTVPFDLPPWEQGKSPATLLVEAIEKIVPGVLEAKSEKDRRALCRKRRIDGIPLRNYGFWSLLLQKLTIEGYNLSLIGGGYNTLLSNWNCADAIPWYLADFSENPRDISYKTPRRGMQEIPERLSEEFQDAGGKVHMKSELVSFNKSEDHKGLLELTIKDHKKGTETTWLTKRLVLALPQWAIMKLARHAPDRTSPVEFFNNKTVMSCLESVTPRTLYKFALAYDKPWWHKLEMMSGHSVTDLPLRQVYYFGTEAKQPGANPKNLNSYIDCSYTDGVSAGYWEGVRKTGPDFLGSQNRFIPKGQKSYIPGLQVSKQMVKRASQQLQEVHGISDIPKPYAAVFKNWADKPYGGGWHTWNIGINSAKVMKKVRQPNRDYAVYICGESYSDSQGWAEGALQTSECMLREHFGLEKPKWLTGKVDLGS